MNTRFNLNKILIISACFLLLFAAITFASYILLSEIDSIVFAIILTTFFYIFIIITCVDLGIMLLIMSYYIYNIKVLNFVKSNLTEEFSEVFPTEMYIKKNHSSSSAVFFAKIDSDDVIILQVKDRKGNITEKTITNLDWFIMNFRLE